MIGQIINANVSQKQAMATNTYDPVTLIANWSEDRSPPLANGGVIADYGNRQYSTVSRDAFPAKRDQPKLSRPQLLAKSSSKNGGDPYTMKGMSYWEDATKERETAETKVKTKRFPHQIFSISLLCCVCVCVFWYSIINTTSVLIFFFVPDIYVLLKRIIFSQWCLT
jgi:hypothetical protein